VLVLLVLLVLLVSLVRRVLEVFVLVAALCMLRAACVLLASVCSGWVAAHSIDFLPWFPYLCAAGHSTKPPALSMHESATLPYSVIFRGKVRWGNGICLLTWAERVFTQR
jgi:hypothetical protein